MPEDPDATRRRWPGLDGLRALAVLAVLGFHFAPGAVPGGFLGVDVFFVLSGYLITRMITTEYLRTGRLGFRNFYVRRARRLLPGLAVVLATTLAAAVFWRDQLTTVRPATAAAAGYASNWWLSYAHQSYFVSAGRPSMLQHLWSLAVEEQFYLLWPLIAVGVLVWIGRGVRPAFRMRCWLAGVALALALASAVEMYVLAVATNAPYGADASRLYYGTDTHSMGLLLGAALGAFVAGRGRGQAGSDREPFGRLWLTDVVAVLAVSALVVAVLTIRESDPRLYRGGFLLVAALAGAGATAVARPGSRIGRRLDTAPLRWLAARSYAIYLWHWPVAVVTRPGIDVHAPGPAVFLLRVAVTIGLADATHRLVEAPVRRMGLRASVRSGARRLTRVVIGEAPVGARLVTAALACFVLLAGGVLAAGPRPTLSAGQRALADAHGGRALALGRSEVPSPVARVASEPTVDAPRAGPTSAPATASPVAHRHGLPAISAFGDSVMLGARPSLDATFPRGTMDAIEGRQPDPILDDVMKDARAGRLYPVVVIGVGDNGLITPDRLRRTLACLHSVQRVIVLNNRVGRPWEGPNNRTIARIVPHFGNVSLLDWHKVSAKHPAWFVEDGIHLTPRGAAAYARLIADHAPRV